MKYITTVARLMLVILAGVTALGQSSAPKPAPELKQWDVWIGDWALSGTAKESAAGPEYKLDWHMHGHWILGGFFAKIDHTWNENGEEGQFMEILSYDAIKKIHAVSGFASDGSSWAVTSTFENETSVETQTMTTPNGDILRCRCTWVFSDDRMAVSGKSECEQNETRWTFFNVKGTKSKGTN